MITSIFRGALCAAIAGSLGGCNLPELSIGGTKSDGTAGSGTTQSGSVTGLSAGAPGEAPCAGLAQPSRTVFPSDYIFNQDIYGSPADTNDTALYLGAGSYAETGALHPDFDNKTAGIPFNIFDSAILGPHNYFDFVFQIARESDPGPYYVPPTPKVENGLNTSSGDHHYIGVDVATCKIYEVYQIVQRGDAWDGYSGVIFDARATPSRPGTWTSADAAGLAMFPLLVKHDEVASGIIRHALRFTMPQSAHGYIYPATHSAGNATGTAFPMGLRLRLKPSFDISAAPPQAKVILQALQHYGMFMADNGGTGFLSGEPNAGWNNDDLNWLKQVPLTAFEVMPHTPVIPSY